MEMATVIYEEPFERDKRLRELGLSRESLIQIVEACVIGRGETTDNDPRSAGGYFAYSFGTRRMRELYRGKDGWDKGQCDGIETIDHHGRKIRIGVVSTDSGTCVNSRSPRNKTYKGPAAEKVTDLNSQIEMHFVDGNGQPLPRIESVNDYTMWYLCVFDSGSTVRAELSMPVTFRCGYFVKFAERIFIVGPGEWDTIEHIEPLEETEPDLEIEIRRK